jgi:aspartate-semialdehyde dehydrogenase
MEKLKCAVLGGTGMVGQRFVQLLEGHPYFEPMVLAASERRKGEQYGETTNWVIEDSVPGYARDMPLASLDINEIIGNDVSMAFSALPADIAGQLETELAEKGIWVFSNASAHRMDQSVPILIPEINPGHLSIIEGQDTSGRIITNANCSTTGLVFGLEPLKTFGLKRVIVTTYQALSGAGYPGVPSTDILGNVVPFIYKEEEKMVAETKRILGSAEGQTIADHPMEIIANCARVPVADGHLEAVTVKLEDGVAHDEIKKAFETFTGPAEVADLPSAPEQPIIFTEEPDRPQPKKDCWHGGEGRKAGMAVTIGRLDVKGSWARFYLLSHNTVRGAAGGSLLNAELAFSRGLLEAKE